jgi:hypothetical protein
MGVEGGRRQELGVRWSSSGNGAAVQSSCTRQGRPRCCFCKHGRRRGEGGAKELQPIGWPGRWTGANEMSRGSVVVVWATESVIPYVLCGCWYCLRC